MRTPHKNPKNRKKKRKKTNQGKKKKDIAGFLGGNQTFSMEWVGRIHENHKGNWG